MTDRKDWARKLMEEKGVKFKDNELRWGKAQTVVNKYPGKESTMYEASLSCGPTLTYMPTQYEKKEHIFYNNTRQLWIQVQHTYTLPQLHHIDRQTQALLQSK